MATVTRPAPSVKSSKPAARRPATVPTPPPSSYVCHRCGAAATGSVDGFSTCDECRPRPAAPVKPAARKPKDKPADTTRLAIEIRGTVYRVSRLTYQDPEIRAAYRLRKGGDDFAFYDIHADGHGAHCTCPDHTFKHEEINAQGCKHIRALRAWRLLPAAAPAPAPRPVGKGL